MSVRGGDPLLAPAGDPPSRPAAARAADAGDKPDADAVEAAREIVLRQLTVRARSREELRKAMAKRQVPDDAAKTVLDRFSEVGLVDDAAFARAWVASGDHRVRSRRALRQELREKGVSADVIDEALEEAGADDEEVAMRFARRKAGSLRGLDRPVAYRRLCGALSRRGFSGSVVSAVAARVLDVNSGEDGGE